MDIITLKSHLSAIADAEELRVWEGNISDASLEHLFTCGFIEWDTERWGDGDSRYVTLTQLGEIMLRGLRNKSYLLPFERKAGV